MIEYRFATKFVQAGCYAVDADRPRRKTNGLQATSAHSVRSGLCWAVTAMSASHPTKRTFDPTAPCCREIRLSWRGIALQADIGDDAARADQQARCRDIAEIA